MELTWFGKYRDFIGLFYRSANAYSMHCKDELLGSEVKFSAYEVQIIEYILEHEDENRNMKWYAYKMGLSKSAYSKCVKKLIEKGLVEKYHTSDNSKNVVLRISEFGRREYAAYAEWTYNTWFKSMFAFLDGLSEGELNNIKTAVELWGAWATSLVEQENQPAKEVRLRKIE